MNFQNNKENKLLFLGYYYFYIEEIMRESDNKLLMLGYYYFYCVRNIFEILQSTLYSRVEKIKDKDHKMNFIY